MVKSSYNLRIIYVIIFTATCMASDAEKNRDDDGLMTSMNGLD